MYLLSSSGFLNKNLFTECLERLNKKLSDISVSIVTNAAIPLKKENRWVKLTSEFLKEIEKRDIVKNTRVGNLEYLIFE